MKIKALLLVLLLLFSIGIITSCSGGNDTEKSSVNTSETKSKAAKYYDDDADYDDADDDIDDDDTDDDDDDNDDDFDWDDALDAAVDYISESSGVDDDDIENCINYKILPDNKGECYFVRYTAENISSDDLLVFKNGKIYALSVDGKSKFSEYKDNFSLDISKVSDSELINNKNCLSGGYGAEFDV